jgi:hypothetical protein
MLQGKRAVRWATERAGAAAYLMRKGAELRTARAVAAVAVEGWKRDGLHRVEVIITTRKIEAKQREHRERKTAGLVWLRRRASAAMAVESRKDGARAWLQLKGMVANAHLARQEEALRGLQNAGADALGQEMEKARLQRLQQLRQRQVQAKADLVELGKAALVKTEKMIETARLAEARLAAAARVASRRRVIEQAEKKKGGKERGGKDMGGKGKSKPHSRAMATPAMASARARTESYAQAPVAEISAATVEVPVSTAPAGAQQQEKFQHEKKLLEQREEKFQQQQREEVQRTEEQLQEQLRTEALLRVQERMKAKEWRIEEEKAEVSECEHARREAAARIEARKEAEARAARRVIEEEQREREAAYEARVRKRREGVLPSALGGSQRVPARTVTGVIATNTTTDATTTTTGDKLADFCQEADNLRETFEEAMLLQASMLEAEQAFLEKQVKAQANVPPAVDSGVPPAVDSGVPPAVDSGVPCVAVDSGVPCVAVDSGVPCVVGLEDGFADVITKGDQREETQESHLETLAIDSAAMAEHAIKAVLGAFENIIAHAEQPEQKQKQLNQEQLEQDKTAGQKQEQDGEAEEQEEGDQDPASDGAAGALITRASSPPPRGIKQGTRPRPKLKTKIKRKVRAPRQGKNAAGAIGAGKVAKAPKGLKIGKANGGGKGCSTLVVPDMCTAEAEQALKELRQKLKKMKDTLQRDQQQTAKHEQPEQQEEGAQPMSRQRMQWLALGITAPPPPRQAKKTKAVSKVALVYGKPDKGAKAKSKGGGKGGKNRKRASEDECAALEDIESANTAAATAVAGNDESFWSYSPASSAGGSAVQTAETQHEPHSTQDERDEDEVASSPAALPFWCASSGSSHQPALLEGTATTGADDSARTEGGTAGGGGGSGLQRLLHAKQRRRQSLLQPGLQQEGNQEWVA